MDDLCSIKSRIVSFYDIVHLWTIDNVLFFLYKHANMCTTDYWPNLWTRFNFLMWVTISLRRYRLFIIASGKSKFIRSLPKKIIPQIQLLLWQYGPVKTSSGPTFDYS